MQEAELETQRRQTQAEGERRNSTEYLKELFGHVGAGLSALLSDREKLGGLVGGVVVVLVAGFGAREGSKLAAKRLAAILGRWARPLTSFRYTF